MKILFSRLPDNPWWGHGTPMYENNQAMKEGVVPNQELVEIEMYLLNKLFGKLPVETIEIDFPAILDQHHFDLRKHDFVFVRDLFISNQQGDIVISRFREQARQIEADIMEEYLQAMGYRTQHLPEKSDCYAEGGEFYYCPRENLFFGGMSRNSRTGTEKTAERLNADELIVLESDAFHLDTVFTPVFNRKHRLCAVIAAVDLLSPDSQKRLREFARHQDIPLVEIPPEDALGTRDKLGEFAVNCLPLPGYLIGPARFRSEQVDPLLSSLGVMHISVPTTQFRLSGGAIHCLTNEL